MLLKIVAIECHPTSQRGGSEKAFFEVLTALKNLGYDVTLFYSNYGDLISRYQEKGINCIAIPAFEIKYFNLKNWYRILNGAIQINKQKPDFIYINQLGDAPLAALAKLFSPKIQIICHLRVPKMGTSKIFNFCGQFIDQFITINQIIQREYQSIFKHSKIVVINDGIEIPKDCLNLKPKKNHQAVYLGRISPEKGLMSLLKSWQILKEEYQLEILLLITGPSVSEKEINFKREIETEIERLDLSNLIQLQDPIENVTAYFSQFDFSIFPSIWAEPFGRTIPESILAGVPVFARKVGIVEEILAPEKGLLTYQTEHELAYKINQFYQESVAIDINALQEHIIKNYDVKKNVLLISKKLEEISIA